MQNCSKELIIEIAKYLEPNELMSLEVTHRHHRIFLQSYLQLWLVHARSLWATTKYTENIPSICPLLERIRRVCPMQILKKAVGPRNGAGLIEKVDYMLFLRSKLLFRKKMKLNCNFKFPLWTQYLNDGKAAYVYAKIETKRFTSIFESELIAINWRFHFKDYGPQGDGYIARFFPDHTLITQYQPERKFSWVLYDGFDGKYEFVQVEKFPCHTFSRKLDGRWQLENDYVIFEQIPGSGLSRDEIPLHE